MPSFCFFCHFLTLQVSIYQNWTVYDRMLYNKHACYFLNHKLKAVFVVEFVSGSNVTASWSADIPTDSYVHLQPSLPPLRTVTGVIGDAIDTGGVILAPAALTLIDVGGTVITLKSCTAVAGI
jgi:hypothetical protein